MVRAGPAHLARLAVLAAAGISAACGAKTTQLRNQQLEAVAKDWSLVIRASQVIPVYPLSEDLQPRDVLLVSTPIEEQLELYQPNGFLPLDQHLVRLHSTGYLDFYEAKYGITTGRIPPWHWQESNSDGEHHWSLAPRAAFPTYQFSVTTRDGYSYLPNTGPRPDRLRFERERGCEDGAVVVRWYDAPPGSMIPADSLVIAFARRDGATAIDGDLDVEVRGLGKRRHGYLWQTRWARPTGVNEGDQFRVTLLRWSNWPTVSFACQGTR